MRSVKSAAFGPRRGRQGGDRVRRHELTPADIYVAGDHNLGHGGAWTEYKQPGLAPYVDAWYEPGVDDYFREAHAKKMVKYQDRIVPPSGHDSGQICVWPNFIMDTCRWRSWHPHPVRVVERWTRFGI